MVRGADTPALKVGGPVSVFDDWASRLTNVAGTIYINRLPPLRTGINQTAGTPSIAPISLGSANLPSGISAMAGSRITGSVGAISVLIQPGARA